MKYTENDLVRIGARHNNTKRSYILINPIQGKHIPCNPKASIAMYTALGEQLKAKYPSTKLIIGFAETATAIGAGVASVFINCTYIHTTRENYIRNEVDTVIEFQEEHSHATEQMLAGGDRLQRYLNETDTVIFIDDELSTGKTIRNIVTQLKNKYPCLTGKTIVAASVINRLSDTDITLMTENGITCEALLKMDNIDYTDSIAQMLPKITDAEEIKYKTIPIVQYIHIPCKKLDPRLGVKAHTYELWCKDISTCILSMIEDELTSNIDVIGTEECMYPAIILGSILEDKYNVTTHSTTRSPIGIINDDNYQIKNGYALPSFYESGRKTFLYNVNETTNGTLIVVCDTKHGDTIGNGKSIAYLYANRGYSHIIIVYI